MALTGIDTPTPARAFVPDSAVLDATWVVIPMYNEAQVIADVIRGVMSVFPHVVCVDDGSRDDSAVRARQAGAVVVRHSVNLGQGASLQTGITYACAQSGCRYVVTFDADGQHQVADALAMVGRAAQENLAIVLGSRFLEGATKPGKAKTVVLKTAAVFSRKKTGMMLTDAHNGLRVLRRDAAEAVHLRQDRMAHATEIVEQLAASGLPYAEHPVHVLYTEYSKSKGQSLFNSINILSDLIAK